MSSNYSIVRGCGICVVFLVGIVAIAAIAVGAIDLGGGDEFIGEQCVHLSGTTGCLNRLGGDGVTVLDQRQHLSALTLNLWLLLWGSVALLGSCFACCGAMVNDDGVKRVLMGVMIFLLFFAVVPWNVMGTFYLLNDYSLCAGALIGTTIVAVAISYLVWFIAALVLLWSASASINVGLLNALNSASAMGPQKQASQALGRTRLVDPKLN